jgi:anaphase-promoting complex subunit 2
LELLKARFGEAPLQSCEVMLKDIQDSGRVNSIIRRSQHLDIHDQAPETAKDDADGQPSLHAKILSRLFWPQLHDETYRIPDEVAHLQKSYEQGFETLKSSRKLTWLHALGQATVELELEDRTIVEEVHTWQATVIWAFESGSPGQNVQKSVDELIELLEMDESLVRSGLKFWASRRSIKKSVLAPTHKRQLATPEISRKTVPSRRMWASRARRCRCIGSLYRAC